MPYAAKRPAGVLVWDLPLRLFHWTLAALVACAWLSYHFAEDVGDPLLVWHRTNGLAILTLVVWRLMWGVAGSPSARFSNFARSPRAALIYGIDLLAGRARRHLGHNPLGAWMVLALLGLLLAQAGLGLFAVDDNDLTGGPLSGLVSEGTAKLATRWHGRLFDFALLPLIGIHVLANVLYGAIKNEPLITAMILGTKPAAIYEDARAAGVLERPLARALGCLFAAVTIVLGGLVLASGGRLL